MTTGAKGYGVADANTRSLEADHSNLAAHDLFQLAGSVELRRDDVQPGSTDRHDS